MGKRGQWSRWGRGMCEGWSLEIGTTFRGSVVRQDRIEAAPTWLASVNSAYLSEHPDRESAMARVGANIESHMEMVLHDRERVGRGRGSNKCYATCCSHAPSHSEHPESQTHASWANHSCVSRQSGQ